MEYSNYDYYKIEIGDIWKFYYSAGIDLNADIVFDTIRADKYIEKDILTEEEKKEQQRFLLREKEEYYEFLRELRDNIIHKINQRGIAPYAIKNHSDPQIAQKFETCSQEIRKDDRPLSDELELQFFIHDDKAYDLAKQILITRKDEDFDYWFALKLEQYQSKVNKTKYFLNYQLDKNYNDMFGTFSTELNELTLQYGDSFLSEKVCLVVPNCFGYLRDRKRSRQNRKLTLEGTTNTDVKKNRSTKKSTRAYKLQILEDKPNYFKQHKNEFDLIYKQLIAQNFINRKTSIEHLKAIFSNKEITPSKRIIWQGKNVELKWFLKYFKNQNLIFSKGKLFWETAIYCFVKSPTNSSVRGEDKDLDYTIPMLSGARDGDPQRERDLEDILAPLLVSAKKKSA